MELDGGGSVPGRIPRAELSMNRLSISRLNRAIVYYLVLGYTIHYKRIVYSIFV